MRAILCVLAALVLAGAAGAGGYRTVDWAADLKPLVFQDRAIADAGAAVTLDAPLRAPDDRRVPVRVQARLTDGALISRIFLIIDENPMPVSAMIELAEPARRFAFGTDMRMNGPSPVRAVVETTDGRLLMTERLVKTSGLGACAAPPVGDPDAAIAAIGQMRTSAEPAAANISAPRAVRVEMRHPQHTGMQMDQITLHYILARYVDTLTVSAEGQPLFTLTGSISLSEDPAIEFAVPAGATRVQVVLTDTDGTVVDRTMPLDPGA